MLAIALLHTEPVLPADFDFVGSRTTLGFWKILESENWRRSVGVTMTARYGCGSGFLAWRGSHVEVEGGLGVWCGLRYEN